MTGKLRATRNRASQRESQRTVTLETVAQCVGLTRGTVCSTLNHSPASRTIPQATQERIFAAARELNYQPNFFARSLRKKRSYTIGILAREIADAHAAMVIAGIENFLRSKEYFFIMGVHSDDPDLLDRYSRLLLQRGVEGFITMDLNLRYSTPLPTVEVATREPAWSAREKMLPYADCLSADSLSLQNAAARQRHLQDLGEAAARILLQQIERGHAAPQD